MPVSDDSYPPISDYGIIGDCRSAALVSKSGSIDWLCWPQFDSPSMFARVVDWSRGGYFSICPIEPFEVKRRYLPDTNVLVTTFETATGSADLIDLMPAVPRTFRSNRITAFRSILRRVEGRRGTVSMKMIYSPRIGYGDGSARLHSRGDHTIYCADRKHSLYLRSSVPLEIREDRAESTLEVREQETVDFGLAYSDVAPAVLPPLGEAATEEIDATVEFWRSWSAGLDYDGLWRSTVVRSALTLKLLCFAPSGAVVAAPTTSLPEWIGGERNWDYRYCWLRDASFTVRALYELDCREEAESYVEWLLHATRLTHPRLNVLYDVYGETRVEEKVQEQLEGYRQSSPVRVGNDACKQVQMDVYGEVMNAIEYRYDQGRSLEKSERRFASGLADYVCEHWTDPDDGIWEKRTDRSQHIHGKVLCWSALRTAVRLADEEAISGNVAKWKREEKRVRQFVLERGWNENLRSFVDVADGENLDASALTYSMIGIIEGDDHRMLGTIDAIRSRLGVGELIYRYRHGDDGLSGDEGAFLTCSFWLVAALAEAGDLPEAESIFDALLAHANDLGLFSEEIDTKSGELLGNFPQGLTHIALINAAVNMERIRSGREIDDTEDVTDAPARVGGGSNG